MINQKFNIMDFKDFKTNFKNNIDRITMLTPNSHYICDINTIISDKPLTLEIDTPLIARVELSQTRETSNLPNVLTVKIYY